MDSDEKDLLREAFPSLDLDNIIILHDGREPTSTVASIGMIAGGGLTLIIAILIVFAGMMAEGESPAKREAY